MQRLEHASWRGADIEQGGLFLPPEGVSVELTDVSAVPLDSKIRRSQNKHIEEIRVPELHIQETKSIFRL